MPITAAVIRGVLEIPLASGFKRNASGVLLDASGRKVLALHPGVNDVSRLAPGIYFISEQGVVSNGQSAVRKVILTR